MTQKFVAYSEDIARTIEERVQFDRSKAVRRKPGRRRPAAVGGEAEEKYTIVGGNTLSTVLRTDETFTISGLILYAGSRDPEVAELTVHNVERLEYPADFFVHAIYNDIFGRWENFTQEDEFTIVLGQTTATVKEDDVFFNLDNIMRLAGTKDPQIDNPQLPIAVINRLQLAYRAAEPVYAIFNDTANQWENFQNKPQPYTICSGLTTTTVIRTDDTFKIADLTMYAGSKDPRDDPEDVLEAITVHNVKKLEYAADTRVLVIHNDDAGQWENFVQEDEYTLLRGQAEESVTEDTPQFGVNNLERLAGTLDPEALSIVVHNEAKQSYEVGDDVWCVFNDDAARWENFGAGGGGTSTLFAVANTLISPAVKAGNIWNMVSADGWLYRRDGMDLGPWKQATLYNAGDVDIFPDKLLIAIASKDSQGYECTYANPIDYLEALQSHAPNVKQILWHDEDDRPSWAAEECPDPNASEP